MNLYFWLGQEADAHPRRRVKDVQAAVAAHYRFPRRLMVSQSRDHARERQIAMFLAREFTPLSLPNIGRHFGGRDHTTIMHGIEAVRTRIANDADLAADVALLRARLAG